MSDKENLVSEENLELQEEPEELSYEQQLMPVSKPWYVYLMAIWAFFGVGGYAMSLSRTIMRENQQYGQILSIIALVFTIYLIVNIIRMNKKFLLINGALCSLLALWGCFVIVQIFLVKPGSPAIYLLLFYILPSVLVAFLSFRSKFLKIADQYGRYRDQEMMRKAALKNAKIK